MVLFPSGTETPFARAVAAEIRAVMAAQRLAIRDVAQGAQFKSHNYLAIRLRDERPFTLDDVDKVVAFLSDGGAEWEVSKFIERAIANHEERYWGEAEKLEKIGMHSSSTLMDTSVYSVGERSAQPDIIFNDGTVLQVKEYQGAPVRPGTVVEDPTEAGRGFIVSAQELAAIRVQVEGSAEADWTREVIRLVKTFTDQMDKLPPRQGDLFKIAVYPSSTATTDWSLVFGDPEAFNPTNLGRIPTDAEDFGYSSFEDADVAARDEDRETPKID